MEQFLCSQTHQKQNAIFFIFSVMAVIWSDCVISSESFLPNELFKYVNNNVFFARTNRLTKDVTEHSTTMSHHNCTATLVQALTVSHDSTVLCLAVAPLLCNCRLKTLTQNFCSPLFMLQTVRPTLYYDTKTRWLLSDI